MESSGWVLSPFVFAVQALELPHSLDTHEFILCWLPNLFSSSNWYDHQIQKFSVQYSRRLLNVPSLITQIHPVLVSLLSRLAGDRAGRGSLKDN